MPATDRSFLCDKFIIGSMRKIYHAKKGTWMIHLPGILYLSAALLAGCAPAPSLDPGYTAGPIEHQLMAEIALQRGEYLVAAQQYLSLAQQSDDPSFAQRATEVAYEYGFDAYALASAKRWVEVDGDDRVAHSYLGRLYVRRNQLDKAWASLNIALGPPEERSNTDYTALSAELSGNADPRNALQLFQHFSDEFPGVAGITGSIVGLAADAGDLDLAIVAARETLVLAPEWVGTRVWLARFLLASGDKSSAFEQMAYALEMNPGLEMELDFVQLLSLADEYEDALERLERLDSRFPGNPDLLRARALIFLQMGDLADAQADFMRLLTDAYFVNECFWYLGQIALQQGDYLQSTRYFRRVSSGVWLVPARLSTSQAYLGLGNPDMALQTLRDFAAAYPKKAFDTLRPQAEILLGIGRSEEALAIITVGLEYKPWNVGLWMFLGGLHEQLGQSEQAIEAFRKAVELAPDNATALNALGYTLTIATRKYSDAYKLISRALELEPENPAIMDSMGWVLFKQGKRNESRVWLERAYELFPDPEVAAHLGELLWAEGDQDAAALVWMKALQDDPDNRVLNETIRSHEID
ncbi:MAG: tetratricopeptide repeat protein [Gammaproteobacteria bacterium]|nr:MAG: tetratricopeptide repeat protein [Gammaproteobacteria bacterium]